MKKIKAFLYVFAKSISSPAYYKELITTPNAFSMKYFVILATIATALVTTKVAIPIIPEVQNGVNKFFEQVVELYPQDLVVTVKDGAWEINQQEPFAIPSPKILLDEIEMEYKPGQEAEQFPTNLIVLDHNGTIEDLENKDTLFVMNGSNIIAKGSDKIEVFPLKDLPNGILDKEEFSKFVAEFRPLGKYVPVFVVVAILIGSIFYFFVYRMMYLLIVTAVLAIFSSAKRLALPFNSLYRISVHTFTLPLSIEVVASLLEVDIPVVFWVFLTNVIFGIVVLSFLKSSTTETTKMSANIPSENAEPKL